MQACFRAHHETHPTQATMGSDCAREKDTEEHQSIRAELSSKKHLSPSSLARLPRMPSRRSAEACRDHPPESESIRRRLARPTPRSRAETIR